MIISKMILKFMINMFGIALGIWTRCEHMSHCMMKSIKITCVPSEDSDQPRHPPSLIRVFAVRMKKHWDLSYPGWSVFAGRTCHFVGFVMQQLIKCDMHDMAIKVRKKDFGMGLFWHVQSLNSTLLYSEMHIISLDHLSYLFHYFT